MIRTNPNTMVTLLADILSYELSRPKGRLHVEELMSRAGMTQEGKRLIRDLMDAIDGSEPGANDHQPKFESWGLGDTRAPSHQVDRPDSNARFLMLTRAMLDGKFKPVDGRPDHYRMDADDKITLVRFDEEGLHFRFGHTSDAPGEVVVEEQWTLGLPS